MKAYLVTAGVIAYGAVAAAVALHAMPGPAPYPYIVMATDDGGESFYVQDVEPGLRWEDFNPMGCSRRPSGPVDVGDRVTNCAGNLALDYNGVA